jgi:predicted CopG family antitoxin
VEKPRVDEKIKPVYGPCMATKTISIDLEAYNRLNAARRHPRDSFSQVIRRAQWPNEARTCGGLLEALPGMPAADEAVIDFLEHAQRSDHPPDSPWA